MTCGWQTWHWADLYVFQPFHGILSISFRLIIWWGATIKLQNEAITTEIHWIISKRIFFPPLSQRFMNISSSKNALESNLLCVWEWVFVWISVCLCACTRLHKQHAGKTNVSSVLILWQWWELSSILTHRVLSPLDMLCIAKQHAGEV